MSFDLSVAALVGLVVVSSFYTTNNARVTRDAAIAENKSLKLRFDDLADDYGFLQRELENRAELQRRIAGIEGETRRLNSTLDGQSVLINRNFSELKHNDKAIADYLGGPVPAAIGMLYARPETTDPAAYRAGAASVRPGAVPAAGPPAAGSQ